MKERYEIAERQSFKLFDFVIPLLSEFPWNYLRSNKPTHVDLEKGFLPPMVGCISFEPNNHHKKISISNWRSSDVNWHVRCDFFWIVTVLREHGMGILRHVKDDLRAAFDVKRRWTMCILGIIISRNVQ